MAFVYLKFPELDDFIEHMQKRHLSECGTVLRWDRKTTTNGLPLIRIYYRLTAKDDQAQDIMEPSYGDILLCEVEVYRGIDSKSSKKYKEMQKETFKAIQQALEKANIKTIDAEYSLKIEG